MTLTDVAEQFVPLEARETSEEVSIQLQVRDQTQASIDDYGQIHVACIYT